MKQLAVIIVILLAGCAANAQTPAGSIDVNALLPRHPLYSTLAQYDRQIAVLQGTLHTEFANEGAVIANSSSAIGRDLDREQTAALRDRVDSGRFPRDVAIRMPAASPSERDIQNGLAQTYALQRAQLHAAASNDLAAYRSALATAQQHAFTSFVAAVSARSRQAYAARAQELREQESELLLDEARRDAPTRLQIRAKLQTLALDASSRARLLARLNAIQAREDGQVNAMRKVHAHALAAYAAELRARQDSDIAQLSAQIQSRGRITAAARERVSREQIADAGPLALPALAARHTGSAADMRAQYAALLHAQPGNPQAIAAVREDLRNRLRSLQQAHAADTQSIESQIWWLRHDRDAVRKRMVAQIFSEAERVARDRGLSRVSDRHAAPAGSVDLTAAVSAQLRALSP